MGGLNSPPMPLRSPKKPAWVRVKVIVGADMNATIGCDSNGLWSYLGNNNDEHATNDNGTRLLSLSQECNLYIMNSLYDSKPKHRHTWYSPTGFTKKIDYILAEWHIKNLVIIVVLWKS